METQQVGAAMAAVVTKDATDPDPSSSSSPGMQKKGEEGVLSSLVSTVKRKISQTLSPENKKEAKDGKVSGKFSDTTSPEHKKLKNKAENKAIKKTKKKSKELKRYPPRNIPPHTSTPVAAQSPLDINNPIEVTNGPHTHDSSADYDTEDEMPLAGLSQIENPVNECPRVLRLKKQPKVKTSRLKMILHRRLTPHKSKPQIPDQTMPPESEHSENNSDFELKKMIKEMREDIKAIKIDGNKLDEAVYDVQRCISRIGSDMVTRGCLDENMQTVIRTVNNELDSHKGEINYNRQKVIDIEENIKDMAAEMETTKVVQVEHDSKIVELEETVIKDLNSFRKELQGFEYRLSKAYPPTPFLPTNQVEKSQQKQEHTPVQMIPPTEKTSGENKNIIIEGLYEFPLESVEERDAEVMYEIGIDLNEAEYNKMERLGTWSQTREWPSPIKIELMTTHKKSKILARRDMLKNSQDHYKVKINPDEPKATRVGRAKLRKKAMTARNEGKRVIQTADYVIVEGVRYDLETIHQIDQAMRGTSAGDGAQKQVYPDRNKYAEDTCILDTPAGMAFFTIRCKLSNFYPCTIRFNGTPYVSVEHAFQGEKAITMKALDKLKDILAAPTPRKAKYIGDNIPSSPLWERIKVDRMRDILNAKYRQNKDLGDYLCSFKGKVFIEGSWDGFWGAGAPLNSTEIRAGTWSGKNILGKLLT